MPVQPWRVRPMTPLDIGAVLVSAIVVIVGWVVVGPD